MHRITVTPAATNFSLHNVHSTSFRQNQKEHVLALAVFAVFFVVVIVAADAAVVLLLLLFLLLIHFCSMHCQRDQHQESMFEPNMDL